MKNLIVTKFANDMIKDLSLNEKEIIESATNPDQREQDQGSGQ